MDLRTPFRVCGRAFVVLADGRPSLFASGFSLDRFVQAQGYTWHREIAVRRQKKFTVVIERDEEGYYIATVPALRGCHTQAKTLDSLMKLSSCAWRLRRSEIRSLS
jgi:hypothetical protein